MYVIHSMDWLEEYPLASQQAHVLSLAAYLSLTRLVYVDCVESTDDREEETITEVHEKHLHVDLFHEPTI